MPLRDIAIPVHDPTIAVKLVYLGDQGDGRGLLYLQSVRSGVLKIQSRTGNPEDAPLAQLYRGFLPMLPGQLSSQVSGPVAAIVCPPTDFPEHAQPYKAELQRTFDDAVDLTSRFQRSGAVRSRDGVPFEAVLKELIYDSKGDEATFRTLLIVDDVFGRGVTAASITQHLRRAGLSADAAITVAVPLWVTSEFDKAEKVRAERAAAARNDSDAPSPADR